jgi:hypothetical protein
MPAAACRKPDLSASGQSTEPTGFGPPSNKFQGVARTTKKRRRKHRGTQGGSIDRRGRASRPRSREEARARARKGMSQKRGDSPPTWSGALGRAAFGAAIFFVLLILIFQRPIAAALLLSVLMMLVYIPLGHAIDGMMYRRRLRAKQREAQERKARS